MKNIIFFKRKSFHQNQKERKRRKILTKIDWRSQSPMDERQGIYARIGDLNCGAWRLTKRMSGPCLATALHKRGQTNEN